ncbi:hypothetical protein C1H46_032744 [Malus baccata]|uniref:Uncharacterized protein n=1 Tax=Malus baccata TaxID=106549 RepID=A0A540L610_MALBA|nr:hypothetical protein C1H46_032744 [Malus baccata]
MVLDALGEKTAVRINVCHACQNFLLVDWKPTKVKLRMEDREEVILVKFQVKSFW